MLKEISVDESGKVDVTKCETLLRTYFINMLRSSADFRSSDSKQFISFLETEIDFINIINSYRLTAYFGESEDEIEKDMLTIYGRITAERHREIYSAPNAEEFIRRFAKTYYGKQIIKNGYDINDLEQSARKLRYKYARSILRRSGSAPLSVYAFIFLLETEVQNIISIIEGIRYGVESNKIASLIIT